MPGQDPLPVLGASDRVQKQAATAMTAEEYMLALALASAEVVAAVHRGKDSGPFTHAALSITPPLGVDRHYTLIALLAAQVHPDTTLDERLAWCRPEVQAVLQAERAA
jgi:hypothetical protein